jgi:phospholipid/cholesterol/gamma-HCH transport system permease protein
MRMSARAFARMVWLAAVMVVLALSPSTWTPPLRRVLAQQLVADTLPVLPGFTMLAALLTLVITRIVVITATTYGLSQYALEMVIRVLVIELLPLTAALFVVLRCTIPSAAAMARMDTTGGAEVPWATLTRHAMPRMVSGLFACVTLAALTCVVAAVLVYLAVYGFTLAGLAGFTRVFGRVFDASMGLILVIKTLGFALVVGLIPMASAVDSRMTRGPHGQQDASGVAGPLASTDLLGPGESRESVALRSLVRLFAVLLVLEAVSLMGNYYRD